MQITFQNRKLDLIFSRYSNNRTAIALLQNGFPYAVATVNLPNEQLQFDEIAVKNYSENSGILHSLIEAGICSQPVKYVFSGFVTIPICKLLIRV